MKKWTKIFLGVLILLVFAIWSNVVKSPTADSLDKYAHLYFFDVGQGDAEMIEKGDYQILIDGGPDEKVLSLIGKAMPLRDRKIEVLILTHPHADHLIGLNSILDRYEIDTVYYSGADNDSNGYREFEAKIKEKNINAKIPDLEEKFVPFENGEGIFLWPGKKYVGKNVDNLNNASEVFKFCYFSNCSLFTGDIETDEQSSMLNYYLLNGKLAMFQSSLLKLSHHGSTNGTNQSFLEAVKPENAIIEVGADNKYGHPHSATLDLLQKNQINYYRTDQDGTKEFIFSSDGITRK